MVVNLFNSTIDVYHSVFTGTVSALTPLSTKNEIDLIGNTTLTSSRIRIDAVIV